jgi:hypothetical protein
VGPSREGTGGGKRGRWTGGWVRHGENRRAVGVVSPLQSSQLGRWQGVRRTAGGCGRRGARGGCAETRVAGREGERFVPHGAPGEVPGGRGGRLVASEQVDYFFLSAAVDASRRVAAVEWATMYSIELFGFRLV